MESEIHSLWKSPGNRFLTGSKDHENSEIVGQAEVKEEVEKGPLIRKWNPTGYAAARLFKKPVDLCGEEERHSYGSINLHEQMRARTDCRFPTIC